ncbi:MAG: hypothetical protein H6818_03025 [Phycisphaerales bacterium]|nr:hypothetical protein [Phycisphaerales bacterium]MCB9864646.1 hypothetical protein [Phycisphaerales bacterium]
MILSTNNFLAIEVVDGGTARALLAVAAVVFILFILNRSARRRRAGVSSRRATNDGADAETTRVVRLKREMEQLLVELNEFAREVNAQIDTRFAKLERSIADADRRISELKRLRGESPASNETDDSVLRANREAAEGVRDRLSRARTAMAQPMNQSGPRAGAGTLSKEDAVYQLADGGKSSIDIARVLKCTVGEVELILNLRGRG